MRKEISATSDTVPRCLEQMGKVKRWRNAAIRGQVLDREFLNLRTCISLNIKLECSSYGNKKELVKTYISRPDPKFSLLFLILQKNTPRKVESK